MAITYDVRSGVALIRIDRPEKLNALTLAMYRELGDSFLRARDDDSVRAVLLTGAGDRAFCVGADLGESIPALAEDRFDISEWDDAHLKRSDFLKPVVAAVNGLCMGGGFEIMLAADIRVAVEGAEFAFPEASMGFTPAGGTLVRLVRQIPFAYAMELMMTSRRFTAERLAQFGLINRVVPRDQLLDVAWDYATRLAEMGRTALAVIKQAALTLDNLPLAEAFRREAELGQRAFTSVEAKEGLRRFAERRKKAS